MPDGPDRPARPLARRGGEPPGRARKPFPGGPPVPIRPPAVPAPPATERVAVGRINATWGLRGHVKVTPFSGNPDRFAPGAEVIVRGEYRRILDLRTPQGYPIVQIDGYEDATAAEALRGEVIEIAEADLPPLPEGEHYIHDLVGLDVVTRTGEAVGRLVEVLTTGANDVYLVRRAPSPESGEPRQRDVLIPAIADVIVAVDVPGGRLVIEPLPGLLDG